MGTEPGAARRGALIERFAALEDPRQAWKEVHPLPEILPLALGTTLAGSDVLVESAAWGEERLDDLLCRFLPYADGTPSLSTRNDVINALDPELRLARGARMLVPSMIATPSATPRRCRWGGSGAGAPTRRAAPSG